MNMLLAVSGSDNKMRRTITPSEDPLLRLLRRLQVTEQSVPLVVFLSHINPLSPNIPSSCEDLTLNCGTRIWASGLNSNQCLLEDFIYNRL